MSLMQPLEGITGLAQEQAIVPPLTRRHVADFGSKNSKTLGSLAGRLSRMKRMWRLSSSGFLVCLLNCCIMWGQATAQITGIVRDQGGTVLPGATVSVTQTDTGITQRVTTDRTGLFVLPNLAPGPYRLEAVLTGFRTYVRTGIPLGISSSPVINIEMVPGQGAAQVQVQGNAPLVETRSSSIGQVFENELLVGLPLNVRSVTQLFTLAGAAVQTATLNIAGGLGFGTAYRLDGTDNRDPFTNQSLPLPFPDAVQEIRVETSGPSAFEGEATSIGAVTKSGTNRFHGGVFEFLTNGDFNARDYFAQTGSSEKGNQFGGMLGGPIRQNKLFFFGGYQGLTVRQDPTQSLAFIPTTPMLAGDFSTFASAACNAGRQISLRPPFVGNRVNRTSLSAAAVAIASRLPPSSDECGQTRYGIRSTANNGQWLGRADYQWSDRHSLFGRYIGTHLDVPSPFDAGNLLTTTTLGFDNFAQSYGFGDTYHFGANMVNAFRLSVNRNTTDQKAPEFFSPADVGIQAYSYVPKNIALTVGPGFSIGGGGATLRTTNYQMAEDLGMIRGLHQFVFGANLAQGRSNFNSYASSTGVYFFNGLFTGLAMADFLLGNVSTFIQSAPNAHYIRQSWVALYGQDIWKVKPRLTLNYGLRWEPFLPQVSTNGKVYNFDHNRFLEGTRSTVFKNAPAGLYFPGDPGFPNKSGIHKQWLKFAPRLGVAWDVTGDGRTSLRAFYGLAYDYVPLRWRINAGRIAPWSPQITLVGATLDKPWGSFPGGNPFPIKVDQNAAFLPFTSYETTPYNIHTPYVSSWNLSFQRQIGMDYLVSATYLGSQTTHMWVHKPLNPAMYIAGGQCTLNGVPYNPCSAIGNTNARRRLSLERPQQGQSFAVIDEFDDGGTQSYNGLLVSVHRRASRRISLIGNYTLSYCTSDYGDTNGFGPGAGLSYLDPNNRRFDRGNCDAGRRHIFNLTAIAETPEFADRTLRLAASGWRISGIYRKSSGAFLTVTTPFDQALTGIANQRPNQVLENPYSDTSGRPLTIYLNPLAFSFPPIGTLGNMRRASIQGPGTWEFDAALSKIFRIRGAQTAEFRAEAYNVTNSFRPGNPSTIFGTPTFGQIRTSLDPRIMQFALKYAF